MRSPRTAAFVLAVVAAIGLLGIPVGPTAPVVVRAATPDLTIVSTARYDVQPAQRRVRVNVDLTLTNRLKDTTTRIFYFDYALLDVLPGASAFKVATEGAGSPSVRILRRTDDYTRIRIDLGSRLRSGKSATYRLTFDLKDPGGAATRDLRVGESLVSFPVWAFATDETPGSSVTVVFPKGYDVQVEVGTVMERTTAADGRIVLRSGPLAEPLKFFAYLVGDRPGAYDESTITTTVLDASIQVTLRAWSDDAPWAKRVGGLINRALPVLGTHVALPWPEFDAPLVVQEAVSRTTGGYAGLFDPRLGKVEIAYYADDFVVLHEAAHAWFNGSLLADRWASESFASYYGARVAAELKVKIRADVLTDELKAARIPLNDWGPVGAEEQDQEDYAYAASLALARSIAERAGDDGLRAVWADAAAGIGAYQEDGGGLETVDGPPDWRGLLDLLEARTDQVYDDLWREWVARPTDLPLLDARLASRARYAVVIEEAGAWSLPRPIRQALRSWRFEDADRLLDEAAAVLASRTEVESAADAAQLVAPAGLRLAFEDDDGFEDATAEATAELSAIDRIEAAEATRPIEITSLVSLGLWGESPEADLEAARDAFAKGELDAAIATADRASQLWSSAESIGQGRAFSIGALILALLLAIGLLIAALRRRQRRRGRMHATRMRT